MIIKIKVCEDTKLGGDIGTYYIDTNDEIFIDEVQRFVCPVRLIKYISDDKDIKELITNEEISNCKVDLSIDLSSEMNDILKNLNTILDIEQYIKDTYEDFDEFGEDLYFDGDLVDGVDYAYNMQADRCN